MRILVIRFSSIGDIVLTTPVVRCIKKQVVNAEIHFVTRKTYAAIVENNPYIDAVHYLGESLADLIDELRTQDFDHIIDLHHNLRSLQIKRALKVPGRSFHKLNVEKWLLTTFKINLMPDAHIVDRYMDTVADLTVENDEAGLDYFIPERDYIKESDIPAGHLAGYIAVVIGATYKTKKLPVNKLRDLCAGIEHPLILIGGPDDREAGEDIAGVDIHKIYNACGKFNLNESADLIRRSKFVISHDTGFMHVATALKKQVISVWGNTVPDFGMYPYYGDRFLKQFGGDIDDRLPYDIVEIDGLACRPCSKIGYGKCPLGHFRCMNKIQIADIISLVNFRLGKN